jgi:hypothetical protein
MSTGPKVTITLPYGDVATISKLMADAYSAESYVLGYSPEELQDVPKTEKVEVFNDAGELVTEECPVLDEATGEPVMEDRSYRRRQHARVLKTRSELRSLHERFVGVPLTDHHDDRS